MSAAADADPVWDEATPPFGVPRPGSEAATLVIEPRKPRTLDKLSRVRWPALVIVVLCCSTALSFSIRVRSPQHQRHLGRARLTSAHASCPPPRSALPPDAKISRRTPVHRRHQQRHTQAANAAQIPTPTVSPTQTQTAGTAPAPAREVPANAGQQRPQAQQGGPFSP
jgi:hypothetical protein